MNFSCACCNASVCPNKEATKNDKSKCISGAELQPLMSTVAGANLPDSQVKQVLELASGADGKIRYEDYVRAVTDPKKK